MVANVTELGQTFTNIRKVQTTRVQTHSYFVMLSHPFAKVSKTHPTRCFLDRESLSVLPVRYRYSYLHSSNIEFAIEYHGRRLAHWSAVSILWWAHLEQGCHEFCDQENELLKQLRTNFPTARSLAKRVSFERKISFRLILASEKGWLTVIKN